jgi:hypothetical protein
MFRVLGFMLQGFCFNEPFKAVPKTTKEKKENWKWQKEQ